MDESGDDNEKMTNGLKQFQEYFGLEPTGRCFNIVGLFR